LKALVSVTRLRSRFGRLRQRVLSRGRTIIRAFGIGRQKGEAFALSEKPKYLRRLLVDDFDRPDVLRPQRDIDQPVARAQVEQRLPIREKPIPYRCQWRPHPLLNRRLQDLAMLGQASDKRTLAIDWNQVLAVDPT